MFDGDRVAEFTEKPQIGEGWINGGFIVFEPDILRLPRRTTARAWRPTARSGSPSEGQLAAYRHDGFWQCMDTLRDMRLLEALWAEGRATLEGLAMTAAHSGAIGRRWSPAATGLVGGWLVQRLLDAGADVVCLVRDWVPQSELVALGLLDRVKIVRGDVCDQALLERVLGEYEIDTVIHLAAQTIVGIANRNPVSTFETNIARHLGAARGLPPQPQRSSRSCSPPPTRPTASRSELPYTRRRRCEGVIPTT